MNKLGALLGILLWTQAPAAAAPAKKRPVRHTVHHRKKKRRRVSRAVVAKRPAPADHATSPNAIAPHAIAPPLIPFESEERTVGSNGVLENAAALVPFFERLSHPPANGSLHILHFGDSHTASDDWAHAMRQALQAKFGAGGPGFNFAGHPYRGYRRFDVSSNSSEGWYTDGLVGHAGDGRYGLGGVSLTARSAGETVSLRAECAELQLFYLRQPGGGSLEFSVDGTPVQTISTSGETGAAYFSFEPTAGSHRYTLRTLGAAPVRLFGWAADNRRGVTYETLGINGAQASLLLDWETKVFASNLAKRDPALILLAYGTNEAFSPKFDSNAFRAAFSLVVERIREASPLASILVVGPPDCLMRLRGSAVRVPVRRLNDVIQVERQVAHEHGCAFWDWRKRMGGEGGIQRWVAMGLAQPDHVHMSGVGYRTIGAMLTGEIIQQFDRFLAARTESVSGSSR